MEKDFMLFNNNIENIGNKEICRYQDSKGNYLLLNIASLLVSVSYEVLDDVHYKTAVFEGRIDKKLKLNKTTVTKKVDKSTLTHKDKDKGIIIDTEVIGYEVWTISNSLRITKSFNNKDEALEIAKEYNEKYLEWLQMIDN